MLANRLIIVIPAFKKKAFISNDLVKKLAGISLIQRSINKSLEIQNDKKNIFVVTDSDEICLIAKRNKINFVYNNKDTYVKKNIHFIKNISKIADYILIISPYYPLLDIDLIRKSINLFLKKKQNILIAVEKNNKTLVNINKKNLVVNLFFSFKFNCKNFSDIFLIIKKQYLQSQNIINSDVYISSINIENIKLDSFEKWWICEKLISRKLIIFRVIGNKKIGTGHIFRAISLARELRDHNIIFVTDLESFKFLQKIVGNDYIIKVFQKNIICKKLISLQTDLVINDILNTTKTYISSLRKNNIKVINFEDLGKGSELTNLTINELFEPQISKKNILWGWKYYFLRDEFENAKPNKFKRRVDRILITFGGTDQLNLTEIVLNEIFDICLEKKIQICIVTGLGYANFQYLKKKFSAYNNIYITNSIGVISGLMENSQIAIASNGRTVFELAHMNIPSIIISQNKREQLHKFSIKRNGFINLGIYKKNISKLQIKQNFLKLISNENFRLQLFNKTLPHKFLKNKLIVVNKIKSVLQKYES